MINNEHFIVPKVGKRYVGTGINPFWLGNREHFEKMWNRKLSVNHDEESPSEFFTVIEINWRGYPKDERFVEHILRGPDGTGKERYDGEINVKVQFEDGKEEWQLYEYDHQWGFYSHVVYLGDRLTKSNNKRREKGNGTEE